LEEPKEIFSDDINNSSAGVLIHADVNWCRKRARLSVLRGCGIFAFCWVVIIIDVWFNLIDLRGETIWTICGMIFGLLTLMGAVMATVYSWSFRHIIVLSSRQFWMGSAISGSKSIVFDNLASLKIEKDGKRQSWILFNDSAP
jgi:hypothetical protein